MNDTELEKKVKQITHCLVYEKGFVCPVDVLLKLGYLTKENYESWRFGKVSYLEQVCNTNLSKLSTINNLLRKTAANLKLDKSQATYSMYGKGLKRKLRFSKSGTGSIEISYATHYIDRKRLNEIKIPKPLLMKNNVETALEEKGDLQ